MGAYESNSIRHLYNTLTLVSDPPNAGILTGGGVYHIDSIFKIIATPKPGYKFSHWSDQYGSFSNDSIVDSIYIIQNETFTAHFTLLTSIKKNIINHIISSLYPNPSQGLLNVAISSKIKSNLKVRVYNILGNLVDDHSIIDNIGIYNFTINTSAYSKGCLLYTSRCV